MFEHFAEDVRCAFEIAEAETAALRARGATITSVRWVGQEENDSRNVQHNHLLPLYVFIPAVRDAALTSETRARQEADDLFLERMERPKLANVCEGSDSQGIVWEDM